MILNTQYVQSLQKGNLQKTHRYGGGNGEEDTINMFPEVLVEPLSD